MAADVKGEVDTERAFVRAVLNAVEPAREMTRENAALELHRASATPAELMRMGPPTVVARALQQRPDSAKVLALLRRWLGK